jgi:pSer/pThr/pTyr-binding forkhead associated (FHA) protein
MYCPECGMQNPDAAHYCARCGGLLLSESSTQVTMSFPLESDTDTSIPAVGDVQAGGPALVVRAGDRAGEHFLLGDSRVTIGRSTGADILLDDVTVSRLHAMVRRRPDGLYIEDADSLNGTYVNRRRIESHRLADGDEIQVGKYKLSYLER